MRIARILQLVALVLVGLYGLAVHDANPAPLALPGLLPLPPALVLLIAVTATFLLAWIPPRVRLWRRGRELARLRKRVAELEGRLPSYDLSPSAPVIPDRGPAAMPAETAGRDAGA